jgi:selenocysteine lyase/cysteine desulfurase
VSVVQVREPIDTNDVDLRLVGADLDVPLVTGGWRRYVNLDYAASTSCLVPVKLAVDALLPWYASVHRGAGYKSRVATDAFEGAREAVHGFVRGRPDDTVIFTRNTTDAINLLVAALPAQGQVFAFAGEHHANLLPWRRSHVTFLPLPTSPDNALNLLDDALGHARPGPRLVAVTGASNVTGEIWPYEDITRVAHAHDARVVLDAAQLAPHRRIDMSRTDVDFVALSGHKLYAPFGAGALVGRADWLSSGEPFLAGGGAVRYVSTEDVFWADLPDRQEAGSPNVVGAVALGVACQTLGAVDLDALDTAKTQLLDVTRERLAALPGISMYRLWAPGHPRIAVLPFNLDTLGYSTLAAALSAEHGIGVRHGCFCAHPLMIGLLHIDDEHHRRLREGLRLGGHPPMPGAVRASIGLGSTSDDLDRFVDALTELSAAGPRWTYRTSADGSESVPEPDPRPWPRLSLHPAAQRRKTTTS